jgi:hypothetical protein
LKCAAIDSLAIRVFSPHFTYTQMAILRNRKTELGAAFRLQTITADAYLFACFYFVFMVVRLPVEKHIVYYG